MTKARLTRFQLAAMWGLRAIAAWALIEGALTLTERAAADASAWSAIASHDQTMARLDAKARAAEARHAALARGAARIEVQLTAATLSKPENAVEELFADILNLAGASNFIVKASLTEPDAKLSPLECEASWTEPAGSAGAALKALQTYLPELPISNVALISQGGAVRTTIRFQLLARRT